MGMTPAVLPPGGPLLSPISHLLRSLSCWNWKCALLSAAACSIVYLTAMMHSGLRGKLAVVLVEMAYVTLTAGLYAGWQQKALGFRSRLLSNLTVAAAVPGFSQLLDWLAHSAVGATAPARATLTVCLFTALSALFHLYVMRRGAFLTGHAGRSLADDFRHMPRLIAGFATAPTRFLTTLMLRTVRAAAMAEAAME